MNIVFIRSPAKEKTKSSDNEIDPGQNTREQVVVPRVDLRKKTSATFNKMI